MVYEPMNAKKTLTYFDSKVGESDPIAMNLNLDVVPHTECIYWVSNRFLKTWRSPETFEKSKSHKKFRKSDFLKKTVCHWTWDTEGTCFAYKI